MKLLRYAASFSFIAVLTIGIVTLQSYRVEAAANPSVPQLPLRFFAQAAAPTPGAQSPAATPNPAAQQSELPDGKGRDLTEKTCSACHATNVYSRMHHTSDEWGSILDNMTTLGMVATDDEIATMNTYLTTYLGPVKPASAAPASDPATH